MRRLAAIRAYGGSMVILNGRAADHVVWRLSVQQLASLAASGIGEATLMPPDDEEGRLGVLTVLENADSQGSPAVDVFVVDPAMMWGARDLGELVRKRGGQALAEVRASRMEGDVYRVVMVPW
jgi:hypothetical protein